MAEFIQYLGWPLGTFGGSGGYTIGRVIDKTGLQGTYDFTFEFAGSFGPGKAFPLALPAGETDAAPFCRRPSGATWVKAGAEKSSIGCARRRSSR
jgi:uncharacterized protein (TIGR03435 family)